MSALEHRVGRGKIIELGAGAADLYCPYDRVANVLARMRVPPDFESDTDLRYTHRRDGDYDIYFVASSAEHPVIAQCTFRVKGKRPQIWDPVTGAMRAPKQFWVEDGRTRMTLRLEAGGSAFVVFSKGRRPVAKAEASQPRTQIEICVPWEVRFEAGRGAPEKIMLDELLDWSKHPDPGVKHFSGQATYRTTFTLNLKSQISNSRLLLDLGQVQVMAQVKLNGQDLGVLWTAPFEVDMTRAAKPGNNTLEITVANLWPNRLIGDQTLPAEQRITWTTWNPYKKDAPLLESGLLGPVRVLECK